MCKQLFEENVVCLGTVVCDNRLIVASFIRFDSPNVANRHEVHYSVRGINRQNRCNGTNGLYSMVRELWKKNSEELPKST